MENIKLVESHRRRIGLLLALLLFLSIYLIIFVYKITSFYYSEKSNNESIKFNASRVESLIKIYGTFEGIEDPELKKVVLNVLSTTNVYLNGKEVVNNVKINPESLKLIMPNEIINLENHKFYGGEVINKDRDVFTYVTALEHQSIASKLLKLSIILLILSPFLYGALALLMCRFMHHMYRPLKDIIINLESFASNINHEFKTSLTEIISSLELAKVTKEYEEANEYSTASAKRLNSMLDSLGMLIHFVNSDYRKERINLYSELDKNIDDLERLISDKHIKLVKKYDPNKTLYKYIDKSPLVLCFQNILKNAIKYSEVGGKIEISIYKNHFSIKDFGVGIEEKNLDKIFDRYFRESYSKSGHGIGLSIIKRITEIYKWEIVIKSEKNKYTKVDIYY